MSSPPVLRLATRGSALALAQAELARAALAASGGALAELVVISTRGDRDQSLAVTELSGQGWFTSELEASLLAGGVDLAVHSAKDLPSRLTPPLVVAGYLGRADPRDALVTRDGSGLQGLAEGARVATSSPRRVALLGAERGDLRFVAIRGNVDTRLRKLEAGEAEALVLACAGLDRLGLGDRITERLDPRRQVPAPAQGAIALESRPGTGAAAAAAAAGDGPTETAVRAERAVLAGLGGGCLLALGAWARLEGGRLHLSAAFSPDGTPAGLRWAEESGDPVHPERLGAAVAAMLRV